jgi:hypothetical protein
MEANVYAPPASNVVVAATRAPEFYVVSRTKFLVLFVLTFGAYQLFWFYKHWSRYRARHRVKLSAAGRSIFPIFFAHSLTERIQQALSGAGARIAWSPHSLATTYVAAAVIGSVCGRLSSNDIGAPLTDLLNLLSLLPIGYSLWRIQAAANLACNEPHGESNRHFTWANWAWIVPGGVLWLVVLVGFVLMGLSPE